MQNGVDRILDEVRDACIMPALLVVRYGPGSLETAREALDGSEPDRHNNTVIAVETQALDNTL